MIRLTLPDLDATRTLAYRLAPGLEAGDVLALEGPLGAGKTAFARCLIEALTDLKGGAPIDEVPSPTFTLVQVYETGGAPVWHFDLYRLDNPEDAIELAIEEAFAAAISLVEWPDRLGPYLPSDRLTLRFACGPGQGRHVVVEGEGRRGGLLEGTLRAAA